jgi:hypothetical protein
MMLHVFGLTNKRIKLNLGATYEEVLDFHPDVAEFLREYYNLGRHSLSKMTTTPPTIATFVRLILRKPANNPQSNANALRQMPRSADDPRALELVRTTKRKMQDIAEEEEYENEAEDENEVEDEEDESEDENEAEAEDENEEDEEDSDVVPIAKGDSSSAKPAKKKAKKEPKKEEKKAKKAKTEKKSKRKKRPASKEAKEKKEGEEKESAATKKAKLVVTKDDAAAFRLAKKTGKSSSSNFILV